MGDKHTYTESDFPISKAYTDANAHTIRVSNTISMVNVTKGTANSQIKAFYSGNQIKSLGPSCFMNCNTLEMVGINNPILYIDANAFRNCTNLSSLYIYQINGIGDNAFRGTGIRNLTLNIKSSQEYLSTGYDYEGCTLNEMSVGPYLGDYCFADNPNLEHVELCTSTELGAYQFYNCPKLSSVVFANHGQCVGRNTFEKCVGLTSIDLPENFETISERMFKDCTNLKCVNIPVVASKFRTVEASAFQNCQKLGNMTFPQSIDSIECLDNEAFTGSNVSSVYFRGIDSTIFDKYVGHCFTSGSFTLTEEHSSFKYGIWYGIQAGMRSDDYKTQEEQMLQQFVSFANTNKIPFFLIACSPDCSYCGELKKMVLQKKSFLEWCLEQPCLFFYSTQNTNYLWKLFNKGGWPSYFTYWKGNKYIIESNTIGIPAYVKYWKSDTGTYAKTTSREGMAWNSDEYISNIKKMISSFIKDYVPQDQFYDKSKAISEGSFRFWGLNGGSVIKSNDNKQYRYNSGYNWLTTL